MADMTESVVEQAALAWLESAGWSVHHGAEIAPGELAAERSDYEAYSRGSNPALSPLPWAMPCASSPDPRARSCRCVTVWDIACSWMEWRSVC